MQIFELNTDWDFRRTSPDAGRSGLAAEPSLPATWERIALPHSPFVADLDGREHWFGLCEYRRAIVAPPLEAGARCVVFVGAAMHSAECLLDGVRIETHSGGYLPFEIDLTPHLRTGATHELVLRLDNRDNADIPPGKPYEDLDFCWYGGLYRGAELRVYPPVQITEAISAHEVAGGGVFVRTLSADRERAVVSVRVHVCNHSASPWRGSIQAALHAPASEAGTGSLGAPGNPSTALAAAEIALDPAESRHVELALPVANPALWSVADPRLHALEVTLADATGHSVDSRSLRIGIRRISFSRSGGFTLNGERLRLRGTNRHQEYPLVGYAAGAAAQWRDARRIKEAGFDYVRCSHYPPAPAFLDACDALGIVVMDAIPGWQFIGGEAFREACFANARQVIRRDRNHACVVLWELSLNETAMDEDFMARLHAIGHEEFPGDQMYTCGWMDRYDVFIHSRQHGRIHSWANGDRALVVAEYGDWEFYATNEGFDQKTGAGVLPREHNSRKFRGDGEGGMLRQAWNHVIALNDTHACPAVLDGQWSVFDYARGYDPIRAACGVADIFRLPKFSYQFYRSQRGAAEQGTGWSGGAMVFLASHWRPDSARRVVVFSNCDEVELSLNGAVVARRGPERTAETNHLPHPPFCFPLEAFVPGTLRATGFLNGKPAATHVVSTPGAPAQVLLALDDAGALDAVRGDFAFVHARVCDAAGTLCVDYSGAIELQATGEATVVGPSRVNAEAGIGSFGLAVARGASAFRLRASVSLAVAGAPALPAGEVAWRR